MKTLVMKFGGTSVGSIEAINQVANIVLDCSKEWNRLIVVVSAMSGVTDALIYSAQLAAAGDEKYRGVVDDLRTRHRSVVDALLSQGRERTQLLAIVDELLNELASFCYSIHILGEVTPRAMDTIASRGERINTRIMAAVLRQQGLRSEAVDATELIVTDDKFQNAAPLMEPTRAQISACLGSLLDSGIVPIVTGFIGATEKGVTTTLGRGGSDYTAAILGDCLDADEVWTWTDVDGVMTADPLIVPDARVIDSLSYSEVSELAYFGAKVLHPKTILPIVQRNIPLWVKNTFNPTHRGTRIVPDEESPNDRIRAITAIKGENMRAELADGEIKAVTSIQGLSMVTIEGRGMLGVPGIAARTFSAVAGQGASVLMISQASSEQSICFVIPSPTVEPVTEAIEEEMAQELARKDIDQIWSLNDVVIVTVVGAGLRSTPGISARIFGALGRASINVIAIAQGSSEYNLSLVVAAEDAVDAVQQIHSEVILNGG
jgi:aspartate kinase